MITEIRNKAILIANQNSNLIVDSIYNKMLLSHNDFCGCDYCTVLSAYLKHKKELHYFLKNADRYTFNDFDNRAYYHKKEFIINKLKEYKNSIKNKYYIKS